MSIICFLSVSIRYTSRVAWLSSKFEVISHTCFPQSNFSSLSFSSLSTWPQNVSQLCAKGKRIKRKKKRKKENIWENAGEFPPGHLSLMENMGIGGVRSEEKQTETRARDTEIIFIWCTTGKFILAAQQKKSVSNNLLMWPKCIFHWLNIYRVLNTIIGHCIIEK